MKCYRSLLGLMLALATPAAAQPPAPGLPVGPCINVGNHFDIGDDDAPGTKHLGNDDFRRIRTAGFQTMRLTVNWSRHFTGPAARPIDPAFVTRITRLIDGALATGLNVIVDSHNFTQVDADPAAAAPRLAAMWRQIAAALSSRPDAHLWFEITNEPHDRLGNANLMATLAPALAAIRETNPRRPVVIGGEFWSGIDSLATLNLPDDPAVYPTFHYYEPFQFTHQGAGWVDPVPPMGRTYGLPEDKARIVADVAKIRAYVARTGRTPFMGETGAYESIPLGQRTAYYRAVADAFRPEVSGMCVWAYTNTFPFYDHVAGRWHPELLEAIGLKGREK